MSGFKMQDAHQAMGSILIVILLTSITEVREAMWPQVLSHIVVTVKLLIPAAMLEFSQLMSDIVIPNYTECIC